MRIWKIIRARVEPKLMGLTPNRIYARFVGPRIIANSIPKGGTHLLTRCLMCFPTLTYSGYHYTDGVTNTKAIEKLLNKSPRGCFSAAHLWWSEEGAETFNRLGVRQIVMIRDPRDVVVSGVHFIENKKSHHFHDYFNSLKSMEEKIIHYIKGVDSRFSTQNFTLADIRTSFANYMRWADCRNTILIKYEDLIGPKGNGTLERQKKTIRKIGEHCRVSLSYSAIDKIANNVFSTQSVTFRKGSSGGWKDYFNENIKIVFNSVAGDLLSRTGYYDDITNGEK